MVEHRSKFDRLRTNMRRFWSRVKSSVLVPDNLLLALIPTLLVMWFIGTIGSLNRNWELQQEIAALDLEKQRLGLEIESLALENQYYASEEYQELTARRIQNKKLPGETMIYLPANSLAARQKYPATSASSLSTEAPSNFQQWMTYLFGA